MTRSINLDPVIIMKYLDLSPGISYKGLLTGSDRFFIAQAPGPCHLLTLPSLYLSENCFRLISLFNLQIQIGVSVQS